uniref:Peroxisome biogenesis protein 22 n=1 Tax=Prorocentrum minimum TaxID=39449 RepID=A0A2K8DNV6_PROMN|nr:Peroxisome biogenesis protein 22 [Prorocentrum minimum]
MGAEPALADLLNRGNAPYLIWTAIALICALFFWLSTGQEKSDSRPRSGKRASRERTKVSISLDRLVLGAEDEDASVAVLLELCQSTELFTIATAESDEREAEVLAALEAMGAFGAGLRRHRAMFSSTAEGRGSMVRQLQPALHLEGHSEVVGALKGKTPNVRLVGSDEWPTLREAAVLP